MRRGIGYPRFFVAPILFPMVDRKEETGKDDGAIRGGQELKIDGHSSPLSDELSSYLLFLYFQYVNVG